MEPTTAEANVQGSAMASWLHQQLTSATGQIATLMGEKAVLEYKLGQALKAAETPEKATDAPD